jgi:hypothetical protein
MYAQQLRDRAGIPSSEAAFGSDGKPRNVFPRDGKALAGTLDAIAVVHDPEGRVRFPVAARDAIGRPAPFTALHSHREIAIRLRAVETSVTCGLCELFLA